MAPFRIITTALEAQSGYLFPWVPVLLSFGIGAYFFAPVEAPSAYLEIVAAILGCCLLMLLRVNAHFRPYIFMLMLPLFGFLTVNVRANWVAEPVLSYRYYGPVEGRIIEIDRSASDKIRLTLDHVVLADMAPVKTPFLVRISLHEQQGFFEPEPGITIMTTAHLSPPSGPVEPGGFDFQRHAWFQKIGAVGYTRVPTLILHRADRSKAGMALQRFRSKISRSVQMQMSGEDGAVAAALMTGDRSGISQETLENLRNSNLAHLLAISGLHMGLLTGFVFTGLRYILAIFPFLVLQFPIKKISAGIAILVGGFYLALSGGNVATERAFIMVTVMFIAVLLDQRAVTLRAVALAAIIVLMLRPEALLGPGFQMSFAATTALVTVFGWLKNWRGVAIPRMLSPVLAVVVSSMVAGLATAPIAAAHFNRIADYGLIANLLSVPLMGILVMPGAVVAACLAPLGLAWVGLSIMQPAIHWILSVAEYVAIMEGAVSYVLSPSWYVLPILGCGALWIMLWRGKGRGVGVVAMALAFMLWNQSERPTLLISESAGLIGLQTDFGRVLNKGKGEGFAASSWLENDGDGADQQAASIRTGLDGEKGNIEFYVHNYLVMHLSGRNAKLRVEKACENSLFVILAAELTKPIEGCDVLDRSRLAKLGAVAINFTDEEYELISSKQKAGQRLWNSLPSQRN